MHEATIKRRGNACHRDLNGIMANSGFGSMFVIGRDGIKYQMPSICLKKTTGTLKKNWRAIYYRETGYAIPA